MAVASGRRLVEAKLWGRSTEKWRFSKDDEKSHWLVHIDSANSPSLILANQVNNFDSTPSQAFDLDVRV